MNGVLQSEALQIEKACLDYYHSEKAPTYNIRKHCKCNDLNA